MRRVLLVLALALAAGCGGSEKAPDDAPAASGPIARDPDAPAPRVAITLLWPSATSGGLVARESEIFATSSPVDRARQVLELLVAGPSEKGLVAPLPKAVRAEALFIDETGTATVSFSKEIVSQSPGGSAWEIAAVNSVVGSLQRSVPQVKRVRILVAGQQVESLTGHLDLSRPLVLDETALAP